MGEGLLELVVTVDGREYRFADQAFVRVGRDPASDVVIDQPTVSRAHATVERGRDGWVYRDAGSSFGSYSAGSEVSKLPIRPGQQVDIALGSEGGVRMCMHVPGSARTAQTAVISGSSPSTP